MSRITAIEFEGSMVSVRDLAKTAGVSTTTIIDRFKKGWKGDALVSRPYELARQDHSEFASTERYDEGELYDLFCGLRGNIPARQEYSFMMSFMGKTTIDNEVRDTVKGFRKRYEREH